MKQRITWTAVFDILIITAWALWIGRDYLNLDPTLVPVGREFNSAIQAHHLWSNVQTCGLCALWNGSARGGYPALVDPLASALHPLILLTTLFLGVVNGAKIALVITLDLAGLAQYWLGQELGLGRWPRLWGALLVMTGGHLAGRMELGIFSVVLATAMVSLTFPAAIRLARTGKPRDMILLAAILALVIVAGQGYMQVGFLFTTPAYLILLTDRRAGMRFTRLRFLLAAGLSLLLAAPFLLPFLHFWPYFVKDSDPFFRAAPTITAYLQNLVEDNRDVLYSTALNPLPYPHMYTMFIGWMAIWAAAAGLVLAWQERQRPLFFLTLSGLLALFLGTLLPLKWLSPYFPFLATLRFAPMVGGLAVPPIVALASLAIDRFWAQKNLLYAQTVWHWRDQVVGRWRLDGRFLLTLFLLAALWQGYRFAYSWLYLTKVGPDVTDVLDKLVTEELQWVQSPFGEHLFIEPAIARGLKLSPGIMTWRWRDRGFPLPAIEASRVVMNSGTQVDEVAGVRIYTHDVTYAAVRTSQGSIPCRAQGIGGEITVWCQTEQAGLLWVEENMWPGWQAWQDGTAVPLHQASRLSVDAPAGEHTYQFRYRPWDVWAGLALCLMGTLFCLLIWRYSGEHNGGDVT